jgi:CrcB protein
MDALERLLLVGLGGAMGACSRYLVSLAVTRWVSGGFPWATFLINVSGSLSIGFLAVSLTHWLPNPRYRLLLIVGLLGGYTTFSSYTLEAVQLWERGHSVRSLCYLGLSVAVGVSGTVLGMVLARALIRSALERAEVVTRVVAE